MHYLYQTALRLATLFYVLLCTLSASAQTKQKATFSTPDLQVFEVKGHVKKITYNTANGEKKYVTFTEDGKVKTEERIIRNKQEQIIRRSDEYDESWLYESWLNKGYGAFVNDGYTADNGTYYFWQGGKLINIGNRWSHHRLTYSIGGDGNIAKEEYNGSYGLGYSDAMRCDAYTSEYISSDIKYTEFDAYGNWLKRKRNVTVHYETEEAYSSNRKIKKNLPLKFNYDDEVNGAYFSRAIEYYTFEEDLERYIKGEGSLDDIAKVIGSLERAKEYSKKTQAEDLWNQRAVEMCRNSRNITADVEKVMKARVIYESPSRPSQNSFDDGHSGALLATETTKSLVIEMWNDAYRSKLQSDDEPTDLVSEILESRFASEALKQNALNHWNEYYKHQVERADNRTECAAAIIDHQYLAEDFRTYILALVHNYEVEHHVNGVTDYEALYREANVKCGSHYVFSTEERKSINHNADQYKRQATNELIVRSQQLMREERYDESRDYALQALAIEPDYSSAIEQRAEVEYRILWNQILAYEATTTSIDKYIHNNGSSKYNQDLFNVRSLIEHRDHKYGGPRKLYKKMVKKNLLPKPEQIEKAVNKCKGKDAKMD